MRIAELSAFHVRIPLKKTIRHASHTRDETETLIIRCRLDDGVTGWGEGLPRPYVTGETIESAFSQLRATDLKHQLGGSFDDVRSAIELADHIELEGRPSDARDCFGNSVRCAMELSLLDAAARLEGIGLSNVTELIPESVAIR